MFSSGNHIAWTQTLIYKNVPIPFFHASVSWDDKTYHWKHALFRYSSTQWTVQLSEDGRSSVLQQYTNGILSWHTIQYFVSQTKNEFVVDEYDMHHNKLARVLYSRVLSGFF